MSEVIDPVNVVYKIQRLLGVDNMEKYNYILGKIHVLDQIKQEISNLLQPKEPEPDDKVTRIRR
jgi:hypothetical protein